MKKIALSDGSGNWFDLNSARVWTEVVKPDERAHREQNGPQEEKLILTAHGAFVIYCWHWRLPAALYLPVSDERGARWLVANGYQGELAKLELTLEERCLEV